MKPAWKTLRRASVITAVTAAVLALAYVPSSAQDNLARVTVTDQAGAPGQMLRQLEQAAGRSLGTVHTVMAIDTAGQELTVDQLEALMAGREVDGVRVLGTMAASRDILGTTMADLADGRFDGTPGEATPTTALLFASDIPQGREWCLTMCIAGGRTVLECILARLGTGAGPVPRWLSFELSGRTTLDGVKLAAERASGVTLGELETVETFASDRALSAVELERVREGLPVDSLRMASRLERPDATLTLDDVEDNAGVTYKKLRLLSASYRIPILDFSFQIFCQKEDDKPWICEFRRQP